jgi:hypothetical protein
MDNDSIPTPNVHYLLSVDKISGSNGRHFHIPIKLQGQSRVQQVTAMVDCGASAPFLAHKFVKSHNILVKRLQSPIMLYNIDMTPNSAGTITHTADLQIAVGGHVEKISFYVTDIGPEDVVLGITWLWVHNPEIDWTAGKLSFMRCTCPGSSQGVSPPEVPIQSDDAAPLAPELIATNRRVRRGCLKAGILSHATNELYAFTGYTYSQKVAKDSGRAKHERTFEEIVPEQYWEFSKVFSDKESERLPEHRPWDHTIDLKEGTLEAICSKVYPMPPNELKELDKFLEENLRRSYITPSKSPMVSPVFFIKKKDGNLRLVQGLWHPVAFRSESMIEAERNYQTWDRKMLAIIRALEERRHYLEGLPQPFEIITDHNNLTFWSTAQNFSQRQAHWALWLSRFNFVLIHKPGKTNTKADALSRRSDHQVIDAKDNNEVQVLKPLHFRTAATQTLIDRDDLTERICKGVTREVSVLEAMEKLWQDGPHKLADRTLEWEERDGLVYYKGRLYIPADQGLRQAVVEQCHDAPTAGHPGRDRTIELVSCLYWWPTLAQFVTCYVAGCDPCQ